MITNIKDKIDIASNNFKELRDSNYTKFLKLDSWLLKESEFFKDETIIKMEPTLKYKRGQIIKVDFGINIGTELSHTHFAIVLNDDDSIMADNITVVPLTSKKGYKRVNLGKLINDLYKTEKYQNNTYAIITQIKTISKKRILLNNKVKVCNSKL